MNHQQAVYLQEMGITRWQVRKPNLFPNSKFVSHCDLSHFSLLVVCHADDFQHPLMQKILSAFNFKLAQVTHCEMDKFEALQGKLPEYIWSTLGLIDVISGCKLLNSPSLSVLTNSPTEKKALWKQFCALNQ